jgi:hypothetical protein
MRGVRYRFNARPVGGGDVVELVLYQNFMPVYYGAFHEHGSAFQLLPGKLELETVDGLPVLRFGPRQYRLMGVDGVVRLTSDDLRAP